MVYCETRGNDVLVLPKTSQGKTPIVFNGKCVNFAQFNDEAFNQYFVEPLNAKGYNIPSSGWLEEIVTLSQGDPIPNWNKYQEL